MQLLSSRIPVTPRLVEKLLAQAGLERAIATGAFGREDLDWTVSLLRDTDTLVNDMRGSPDVITPIRGLNRRVLLTDDELARVTAPTLLLWGAEDPNGGPDVARAFAARLPDCRLDLLADAGHAPWLDRPEHCATATVRFLSR